MSRNATTLALSWVPIEAAEIDVRLQALQQTLARAGSRLPAAAGAAVAVKRLRRNLRNVAVAIDAAVDASIPAHERAVRKPAVRPARAV